MVPAGFGGSRRRVALALPGLSLGVGVDLARAPVQDRWLLDVYGVAQELASHGLGDEKAHDDALPARLSRPVARG